MDNLDLNSLPPASNENSEKQEKKEIILTESQQLIILEMLNANQDKPPMIKEIIEKVFGEKHDARTFYGMAVRKFIGEKGLKFHKARDWVPEKVIVLTEEQKEFIGNNILNMKPLESARLLFNNENLTNLDLETRAIQKYIQELPMEVKMFSDAKSNQLNTEDYKPPKTEDQTLARINRYVTSAEYVKEKLTEKQKREVKFLMKYLHIHRFMVTINEYETVKERDLFESEYVRGTFNKSQLTQEQLDQYIMYAGAVVDEKTLGATIKQLRAIENECLAARNTTPQALADRLNDLSDKYEKCVSRQNSLLKSLEGERKETLKDQQKNKQTMVDLVMFWQNEQKRKRLIELADLRRQKVKDEIERLRNIDELKFEIWGVNEDEILNS